MSRTPRVAIVVHARQALISTAGRYHAYLTYAERKVIALMQDRIGPNRAGPFGLLQPIADGIKLLGKEDLIPAHADKEAHWSLPVVAETYDGWLNDINGMHVKAEHVAVKASHPRRVDDADGHADADYRGWRRGSLFVGELLVA